MQTPVVLIGRYKWNPSKRCKTMSNISENFQWQLPWCPWNSLGDKGNSLVTSRLGSCSSAMSNSPAFFLPFCFLALFSSTKADVGSMIDRAVSSSQDKTQENISRLWTLHESHFWLWRWGRQANTDVICQRRSIEGSLDKTSNRHFSQGGRKNSDLTVALTQGVSYGWPGI